MRLSKGSCGLKFRGGMEFLEMEGKASKKRRQTGKKGHKLTIRKCSQKFVGRSTSYTSEGVHYLINDRLNASSEIPLMCVKYYTMAIK